MPELQAESILSVSNVVINMQVSNVSLTIGELWAILYKFKPWHMAINSFHAGTVFIRQNLTYKDGPGTEIIKIFLAVVDP